MWNSGYTPGCPRGDTWATAAGGAWELQPPNLNPNSAPGGGGTPTEPPNLNPNKAPGGGRWSQGSPGERCARGWFRASRHRLSRIKRPTHSGFRTDCVGEAGARNPAGLHKPAKHPGFSSTRPKTQPLNETWLCPEPPEVTEPGPARAAGKWKRPRGWRAIAPSFCRHHEWHAADSWGRARTRDPP